MPSPKSFLPLCALGCDVCLSVADMVLELLLHCSIMASRTLFEWAVPKAPGARRIAEQRDARHEAAAQSLGMPWPEPRVCKRRVGKPTNDERYREAVYAAIRADALPPGTTAGRPSWWRPGLPLVQNIEAEVAEATEVVPVEPHEAPPAAAVVPEEAHDGPLPPAAAPKKKYGIVAQEVKDWYLEWWRAKQTLGWTHHQAHAAAVELAPSLFEKIHKDTPRQWKHSSEIRHKRQKTSGRPLRLSAGEASLVAEAVQRACAKLPLSLWVLVDIANKHLAKHGVHKKVSKCKFSDQSFGCSKKLQTNRTNFKNISRLKCFSDQKVSGRR